RRDRSGSRRPRGCAPHQAGASGGPARSHDANEVTSERRSVGPHQRSDRPRVTAATVVQPAWVCPPDAGRSHPVRRALPPLRPLATLGALVALATPGVAIASVAAAAHHADG